MKKSGQAAAVREAALVVVGKSPVDQIKELLAGGAKVEDLEKMLGLQERWEAGEAKKAYHKAMAAFKTNPPKIEKDKLVSFSTSAGQTSYRHARLASVTEAINAELSKYGLSASWETKQNGGVTVTCRITHELGHSEEVTLTAQPDTSGSKNAIQAIGSTITYLERYTLLAATGLAADDQDDDGQAAGMAFIDDKQKSRLLDMLNELGYDAKHPQYAKFLGHMRIESIDKIPTNQYQKAVQAIEYAKKQKAAVKKNEVKKAEVGA